MLRTPKALIAFALTAMLVWCQDLAVPASAGGAGPSKSSWTSADINGLLGGTVRLGRWTVLVPPGAYVGTGSIRLTVPNGNPTVCDLDIKPGNLNKFLLPVQLIFSTSGLTGDLSNLTIYWYDPSTATWVDVHGVPDAGTLTLVASLSHFSTYAAGKAGW